MGIDVEDIKLCVSRVFHFSLRVSHRFVQKHPRVSGALLLIFILYIFLPSVLRFLFYSLPFVGFGVILLAFWISKRSTNENEKEDKSKPSGSGDLVNRDRRPSLRNVTSRRRRFTDKSGVWNAEAPIDASAGRIFNQPVEFDSLKALIDGRNNSSAHSHSTSVDKNIEIPEQNHPILGSEVPVISDLMGCDYPGSQTNKSDSEGDETKIESSEDVEDEDEEETQEDRDKAVEWTENDQRNLMDLGLSELERNRRLESLIARRRARKSHKRKVDGAHLSMDVIPPGEIPKIVTTRNDPFDVLHSSKEMGGVSAPGSAPSVLLPMRNPFDLPYDPLEEKPNLTGDSFHQEFTAVHQREVSYCRHESFCLGPGFLLGDEGGGMGYPRYRRPSADKGDHDWLIEQLLFNDDRVSKAEKSNNVVDMGGEPFIQTLESSQIEDDKGTATTLNTIDVNGTEKESVQGKKNFSDTDRKIQTKSQPIQDSNGESSPSSSPENPEVFMSVNGVVVSRTFDSTLSNALSKMVCHTPTYSIASDMQVEVSEIGSPPLTVDGNNSQTDGESLHHDWEIEKEINSGDEELRVTSFDLLGVKEKQLESRDVREANDEATSHGTLLGIDMNSENPVSSPSEHLKYGHEQDDLNSLSGEVPNEIKASSGSDGSAPETTQIATQSIKGLADQSPEDVLPQKPEELSSSPVANGEVINDITEQKDADADALGNMENITRTCEDTDGGFIDDSKDPPGYQDDLDRLQPQEGSNKLNQIADTRDLGEISVHGSTTETLTSRETREQTESIKDDKNGIHVVESDFWNADDAINSTMEQDSVIEEVPLDSDSRLSQLSSSNSNDMICADASECLVKDMEKTASSCKPDLPLTVPELEDATTQSSNTSNVEKLQEPSMTLKTYEEEEAHTVNNLDEPIVDGKTNEENSEHNEAVERESEVSIINEVATDPPTESPITEVQTDTEQVPTVVTITSIQSVGNGEFDMDMEGNSENLIENVAVVSPSRGGEISNSKHDKDSEDEVAMETEKRV